LRAVLKGQTTTVEFLDFRRRSFHQGDAFQSAGHGKQLANPRGGKLRIVDRPAFEVAAVLIQPSQELRNDLQICVGRLGWVDVLEIVGGDFDNAQYFAKSAEILRRV